MNFKKMYLLLLLSFFYRNIFSMLAQYQNMKNPDISSYNFESFDDFDQIFLSDNTNEQDRYNFFENLIKDFSNIYKQELNTGWINSLSSSCPSYINQNTHYIKNYKNIINLGKEKIINRENQIFGFFTAYAQKIDLSYLENFEFYCIGDLHANYAALKALIQKKINDKVINDKLIVDENKAIFFLGDFTDRGEDNLKTIALIFMLKILNPENVFILKGNHEGFSYRNLSTIINDVTKIFGENRNFEQLEYLNNIIFAAFNLLPTVIYLHYNGYIAQLNHGGWAGFDPIDLIKNDMYSASFVDVSNKNGLDFLSSDISVDAQYPNEQGSRGNGSVCWSLDYVFEQMEMYDITFFARAHDHDYSKREIINDIINEKAKQTENYKITSDELRELSKKVYSEKTVGISVDKQEFIDCRNQNITRKIATIISGSVRTNPGASIPYVEFIPACLHVKYENYDFVLYKDVVNDQNLVEV